jgi:hypothetical protein
MKKYVQIPTNLYFTFFKSVGNDDRDCRSYDLMHKRSRDIYKIQGELQKEGNTTQYNSPGRGNFNLVVDSEDEDEEEVWVEFEHRSSVIIAHSQDTWQGIVRTLALLVATATPSSMLLKNVQSCWLNFKRNKDLSKTHRYN